MNNPQLFMQEVESRIRHLGDADCRIQRNLDAQYISGMIYGAMLVGVIDYDQWQRLNDQVVVCQLAPVTGAA
jgi:hypothetical protein